MRSFGESTIQFVRSILGDSESAEYKILKSYDPEECDGALFVIGDTLSCGYVAGELLASDDRDNIDGVDGRDGLPDFAGERIALFEDVANGLYDSLVLTGRTDLLRELTVRSVLKAVDTLCFLSPFDMEGLGKKSVAKMVVLASPAMEVYGAFDVDSLLNASNCLLPVISPVSALAHEVLVSDNLNVGVLTSAARSDAGIFPAIFNSAARSKGFSVNCVAIPSDVSGNVLHSFLDAYREAGNAAPLDIVLVDDTSVSIEEMERTLSRIRDVMFEESLKYSDIVSAGFRIVRTAPVLRRECYRTLRERNLFTHNIAYPVTERYLNISRDASVDLSSNIIVEFNESYLPR